MARGLALRNRHPDLFLDGQYLPLTVSGPRRSQAVAFAREKDGLAVVTVACRLPIAMLNEGEGQSSAAFWGDTQVELPATLARMSFRDVLTGREIRSADGLLLRDVMDGQTVALLVSEVK